MNGRWTRRRFLGSIGLGSIAAAGTVRAITSVAHRETVVGAERSPLVDRLQWGVAHPQTPLPFVDLGVIDVGPELDARSALDALGHRIQDVTAGRDDEIVTIVVGAAASMLRRLGGQPARAIDLELPRFSSDGAVAEHARGGDICLQVCAGSAATAAAVFDTLVPSVTAMSIRWRQAGSRPVDAGRFAVNPLGFADGIAVPRNNEDLVENVTMHGRRGGATVMVVRRVELDTRAFDALSVTEQEQVIGRRRDGSPLSGGGPEADVDLRRKTASGRPLIPLDAHVRAAHPSITGSRLMLRRSYNYADRDTRGLLFISFQREIRTFVATQRRIDEVDALAGFMTPTASFAFLVPPTFSQDETLGSVMTAMST